MIPYSRQTITDEDLRAVTAACSGDLLTTGPLVSAFENELCKVTGAAHAVACANGTAALHLACLALDLKPGALGYVPAITFLASANCIEYCGGRADFLDIEENTLCLNIGELQQVCGEGKVPELLVPVSFAGLPVELPRIRALSDRYSFRVIEDAAHSLGSTYSQGGITLRSAACTHSDLAILSFHPVKTITTGEGGAVLTNDGQLAERLRLFRSHGMTKNPELMSRNDGPWYYEMTALGYNYRITDFQCALGLSQLRRLEESKQRRLAIARRYREAFVGDSLLTLPPWPENSSPCFHLFPLQFKEGKKRRKQMYFFLQQKGIQSQVHYIPVYWQPYYRAKYGFKEGKCPVAESYYSRCLSIPLFCGLSDEEVSTVIEAVLEGLAQPLNG